MMNYVIIIIVVATLAIGQLLFKTVGVRLGDKGFSALLHDRQTLMIFLSSLALYGVATLGWIWGLRQIPLSTAYLFMSLAFVLVPLAAWLVLGEPISTRFMYGTALIIIGIVVAAG